MRRFSKPFFFIACIALLLQGCAHTVAEETYASARDEIWALEQSVYANRSAGNFKPYVDAASDNYIIPMPNGNWTPGKDGLKATQKRLAGNTQERLEMNFKAFTLEGNTAVIYYLNHRTRLPDGTDVDQWYEVMHVWHKRGGDWRLLASMPRQLSEPPKDP